MSWWKVVKSYSTAKVSPAPEVVASNGLHVTIKDAVPGNGGGTTLTKINRCTKNLVYFDNQDDAFKYAEQYLTTEVTATEVLLDVEAARLETLRDSLVEMREQRGW